MEQTKKKKIIKIILIIAIVIALFGVGRSFYEFFKNNSRTNYLRALVLGSSTKEEIKKQLGTPDEMDETETQWVYYDEQTNEKIDEIEKLLDSRKSKDAEKGLELLEELCEEEHRFTYIAFDKNDRVKEIFYDSKHNYNPFEIDISNIKKKTLKSIELPIDHIEYAIDEIHSTTTIDMEKLENLTYIAEFKDKSFYKSYCNGLAVSMNDDMAVFEWANEYAEYKINKKAILSSKLTASGDLYCYTNIPDNQFKDNEEILNIIISKKVESIGDKAFANCNKLQSVTFEKNSKLEWIGSEAFRGCTSLTSIIIPSSVTSIRTYAFSGCSSLMNIDIPNGVTMIGEFTFYKCSSLMNITIPSSVTSIGTRAFENCSSLTSIVIPSSVTSIRTYAFSSCSSLTIYCEANAKPEGWDNNWNGGRPVYWAGEWSYVGGIPTPNNN